MIYLCVFLLLKIALADTLFSICEWRDAQPGLYYEYHEEECPAKFHLLDNGECEHDQPDHSTCASFCQMRTTFYYGQEQPFVRIPVCRGGSTCRITEAVHQGYGWKAKLNGNFKESALTVGVSPLS